MSDTANAIMDAAERRIREGGYGGFSFRELASDVGVKSSSVHYHFPTKGALAAAVIRRYTKRILDGIDEQIVQGSSPTKTWAEQFRAGYLDDRRMCLCGALGATAHDLPPEVVVEARSFFSQAIERMVGHGMGRKDALRLMAMLEGALLMANIMDDIAAYDAVAAALLQTP